MLIPARVAALLLVVCCWLAACQADVDPDEDTRVPSDPATSPTAPPATKPSSSASPSTAAPAPSTPLPTSVSPDGERPNVVLFLTDDQTLEELAAMPQTRSLIGDRGTTFSHALSQYPLCCPARATLLTGQLPHNHRVLGNEEPWGGYAHFNEGETLPLWLQRAGYRTGMVGKYLNGYPLPGDNRHVPVGYDDWMVPVDGVYRYYQYTLNENGALAQHTEYQADFTGNAVSELVEEYAAGKAPFYIWAGFLAPHIGTPIEPDDPRARDPRAAVETPAVAAKYRDTDATPMPAKESRPELDDSDKVPYLRGKVSPPLADLQEKFNQRREALHSVDDAIAHVVETLRSTGELDHTLLVFASDNGFLLGEHNVDQKIYGYEESIRVPLLIAGPGFEVGVVRDQLVGLADVVPTILAATGATPTLPQDGIALQPLSADAEEMAGRSLLLEAGGWPFPRKSRLYTGVRTPDGLVLLHWYDGYDEVYDLATDPLQLDGSISPTERQRLPELLAIRKALVHCVGAECSAQ